MKQVLAFLVLGSFAQSVLAQQPTAAQLCAEKAEVIRTFKIEMAANEKSFLGDLVFQYDCAPVKDAADKYNLCLKILTDDYQKSCQQ